jgi:predicted aminopeptidase
MRWTAAVLTGALLSGCSSSAYLWQLARGQVSVLQAREPIAQIIERPTTDPALRARLQAVLDARSFASARLALPDNASYTVYADIHRDAVLWNVFATPELSLQAKQWCYPLMGCFAYRGYYDQAAAEAEAQALRAQGLDVSLGAVPAYSTLGWFDDPVFNTMLGWSDEHLIGTVFHELTHQKLHLRDDTAFNESLASFVEQQGWRAYREDRQRRGLPALREDSGGRYDEDFTQLILTSRDRLEQLYDSERSAEEKRRGKAALFEQLRQDYVRLRDDRWGGYRGYDAWMQRGLNNARLLPFGLYDTWVPAFAALFAQQQGRWPEFFEACAELGRLSADQRRQQMKALLAQGTEPTP